MRTSILCALAVSVLVPSTALADGEAPVSVLGQGYVTPTAVPYEGGEIPENAKIVSKPRIAVLGTGIGLFAASYAGALIYGLATCSAQEACRGGSNYLYIPFVGPFITAAVNETPTTGGRALAAFDGGVQLLGAALAVAGFVWPQKFVMWQSKSAALKLTPTGGGLASTPAMLGDNRGPGSGFSAGVALTLTHL